MLLAWIQWIPVPNFWIWRTNPVDLNSVKKASETGVDPLAIKTDDSLLTTRDSSPTITALLP
jgi:hypothetical protein